MAKKPATLKVFSNSYPFNLYPPDLAIHPPRQACTDGLLPPPVKPYPATSLSNIYRLHLQAFSIPAPHRDSNIQQAIDFLCTRKIWTATTPQSTNGLVFTADLHSHWNGIISESPGIFPLHLLGQVGLVEEKPAKFQVVLNAELPLKFDLRVQLPSGEIVPVSLEYVNLHRWCHSNRRISHEFDTCPLLTEEQREHHRLTKENNRDQGQQSIIDSNRKGDLSKRFNVAGKKPPSYLERCSGEGTQRDNRDSVWKRIDSRYAPRDDHRENNRQA
ncbi:hypothetical protein YC2023_018148 [Brassica napus]